MTGSETDPPEISPRLVTGDFDRILPSGFQARIQSLAEALSIILVVVIFIPLLDFGGNQLVGILTVLGSVTLLILGVHLFQWVLRRRAMNRLEPGIRAIVRRARRLPSTWQQWMHGHSTRSDELVVEARRHHPDAVAFVGSRALREIEDIVLSETLFEPTSLAEGGRLFWSVRSFVLLGAGIVAIAGPMVIFGLVGVPILAAIPCSAPFLLLGSVFLKDIPWFNRWWRKIRRQSMRTIVGPGFLVTRGKVWSRDDSVLILYDPRRTDWRVEAALVGPEGVRRLRFDGRRDPDLKTLWQAWAHPRPRVDLVHGVLVSLAAEG